MKPRPVVARPAAELRWKSTPNFDARRATNGRGFMDYRFRSSKPIRAIYFIWKSAGLTPF
jgi:hypothetical protein